MSWQSGVDEFNRGRWWHAHEEWEQVWKQLAAGPAREQLQAQIQAAACFHLLEEGRVDPALRLAASARAKLLIARAAPASRPRVDIPGLLRVLRRFAHGSPSNWRRKARALHARVVSERQG